MQAAADHRQPGITIERSYFSVRLKSYSGSYLTVPSRMPFSAIHLQFLHFSISHTSIGSASSAVSMTCRKMRLASTFT